VSEPAFPQTVSEFVKYGHGMTLRDYFAAKALIGLMAEPQWSNGGELCMVGRIASTGDLTKEGNEAKQFAVAAYILADAMLAERNR
jgi:hypothetical protein